MPSGVVSCLRWGPKMANFSTTHRHDFRWPNSTCLIPKAEAPNGHCERRTGGESVDKPWCGRDAPLPPPPPQLEQELPIPRVCPGLVPATDKPWCQRGLLVPQISPPIDPSAPQLRVRPENCPNEIYTTTRANGCYNKNEAETLSRQKYEPRGCCERFKESINQNLGPESCSQSYQLPQSRKMGPTGCFESFKPSGDSRTEQHICTDDFQGPNVPKRGFEGRLEEPLTPNRPWCNNNEGPALVSARVGAAPQQDTSRYNQPNQYLQILCDKYPQPTAVVTATPRDELMRRVYADRYRTTYQTDYCKTSDDTVRLFANCDSHDPGKMTAAFNSYEVGLAEQPVECVRCKCGCSCSVMRTAHSAGDTNMHSEQSAPRPTACRPATVSHNFHFSCCSTAKQLGSKGKGEPENVGRPEKLPPWTSEYSDGIGLTAQMIMDQKLHHPNQKKQRKF